MKLARNSKYLLRQITSEHRRSIEIFERNFRLKSTYILAIWMRVTSQKLIIHPKSKHSWRTKMRQKLIGADFETVLRLDLNSRGKFVHLKKNARRQHS